MKLETVLESASDYDKNGFMVIKTWLSSAKDATGLRTLNGDEKEAIKKAMENIAPSSTMSIVNTDRLNILKTCLLKSLEQPFRDSAAPSAARR